MSPGDAILWINPDTGQTQVGIYIAPYGAQYVIQTATHTGHLGLRYVNPKDVRAADNGTGEQR